VRYREKKLIHASSVLFNAMMGMGGILMYVVAMHETLLAIKSRQIL
jgi:hypothetical protein